jgi:predicted Ser/Thr protein kinase
VRRDDQEPTESTPSASADGVTSDALLRDVARISEPAAYPLHDRAREQGDVLGHVLGHFRVLSVIGRGGMGVVYLARDETLRRDVALKVLPRANTDDPERRGRFLREARSAAAVTHPCVATIHEVGEAEGRVFIAMELVEGRSLRAHLAAGRPAMAEVVAIAKQVARGLAKAHEKGIVHRDLKPENVMLDDEHHVKILDFGLAKPVALDGIARAVDPGAPTETQLTGEGRLLGTPAYMSPEQIRGVAVDGRSDLFSFGVMLYEMLAGVRPFQGTSMELLVAIARDEPPPIAKRRPGVPGELEAIVRRCLQKDPAARYASAQELYVDLDRLGVIPGETLPPGPEASSDAPALTGAGGTTQNARMALAARGVDASKPSRTWPLAVLGLAVLAAAGALVGRGTWLGTRGAQPSASAATASSPVVARLLDDPRSKLGCAVFDATGVSEPAGWLGAASSSIACRRMQWLLGGDAGRVVPSAALLDMPTGFIEDRPPDPYAPPELREKSRVASASRASATLDGSVEATPEGFRVELRLLARDGREAGRGAAAAENLWDAITLASNVLGSTGTFPVATQVTAEAARTMFDVATPDDAWELQRSEFAHAHGGCKREYARTDLTAARRKLLEVVCSKELGTQAPTDLAPIDTSSADALGRSVWLHLVLNRAIPNVAEVGAALQAAAQKETNEEVRYGLLTLAMSLSPNHVGSAFLLQTEAARQFPWAAAWGEGEFGYSPSAAPTVAAARAARRASRVWAPFLSGEWANDDLDPEDAETALRWVRRAHELHPANDLDADNLGMRLVAYGKPNEARALAARLLAKSPPSATYLVVAADGADGFPARALAAARRLDEGEKRIAGGNHGDFRLARQTLGIAAVLGTAQEQADAWVDRFVLAEPPRLSVVIDGRINMLFEAIRQCLYASKGKRLRCLEVVDKIHPHKPDSPQHFAQYEGAVLAARGDLKGAVRLWRPLLHDGYFFRYGLLPVDMIEDAGELEFAEQVDEHAIAMRALRVLVKGHGIEDLRMARRAWKRGDKAAARRAAAELLTAWSTLDVAVPWLDELRKMAAGP